VKSLAIISTHPIQYYSPVFRLLAKQPGLQIKIYYDQIPDAQTQGKEFGHAFQWDVDLLSGYDYAVGKRGMEDLQGLLQDHHYSAVLLNGWHSRFLWRAGLGSYLSGTPLIIRGDSHLRTPRSKLRQWIKEPLYQFAFSKIEACLAVGIWNAEYFRHFGVPSHKIFQSPHSVDNDWFKNRALKLRDSRSQIRKKWGIADNDFVFSYIGKFIKIKKPQDFVEAFLIATQAKPSTGSPSFQGGVKGLMVGDGPLMAELESRVKNAEAQIKFTGFLNQTEVVEAYIASDCLVLPGQETWGLVVNEAIACGLPVIVSDEVGCGPDVIDHGKNGMIFRCGDVRNLAQKMTEWCCSAVSREAIRSVNEQVLQKYSCQSAVRGILQGLDAVDEKF
jgi:glycosyltransferase involved in cell wall biosynthesis